MAELQEHEKALRALWRKLAEKDPGFGVDWPRIILTLFRDLDAVETDRDHWKDHAEEAGRGFSQVCRDAARIAARNTVLVAQVEHARTWITNCVDPLEVGPKTKQQMLDALVTSTGADSNAALNPGVHVATPPGQGSSS